MASILSDATASSASFLGCSIALLLQHVSKALSEVWYSVHGIM